MHQIPFLLGLPDSIVVAYITKLPRPYSCILWDLLLRRETGRGKKRDKERKREEWGGEGKGQEN